MKYILIVERHATLTPEAIEVGSEKEAREKLRFLKGLTGMSAVREVRVFEGNEVTINERPEKEYGC